MEHHGGRDILTQPAMRDGKGRCLSHRRVVEEDRLDFLRHNFFPATINDLLDAAEDKQVAVSIDMPLVPGPEPAVRKSARVGEWIVIVALQNGWTTYYNFARCP